MIHRQLHISAHQVLLLPHTFLGHDETERPLLPNLLYDLALKVFCCSYIAGVHLLNDEANALST